MRRGCVGGVLWQSSQLTRLKEGFFYFGSWFKPTRVGKAWWRGWRKMAGKLEWWALCLSFAQLRTPGHGIIPPHPQLCLPSSSKPSENTQDSYIQRCVSTVTINPIRLIIGINTTRHSTNPPSTTPAVLEHRTETCSQGHSKPYHYSIICGLNGPWQTQRWLCLKAGTIKRKYKESTFCPFIQRWSLSFKKNQL